MEPMQQTIESSWQVIAPFWPLKNLIAVNPLRGFEGLPFKQGLEQAQVYFQQANLPTAMHAVNRLSIKWLQAYFDLGQSTISMPQQDQDIWNAVKPLLLMDGQLPLKQADNRQWLRDLPPDPLRVIEVCLQRLGIVEEKYPLFLTLMLTTLPGWASHVQYQTAWSTQVSSVTQAGYLAFRLVLTNLLWPQADQLLFWHEETKQKVACDARFEEVYDQLVVAETRYQTELLQQLRQPLQPNAESETPAVQLVFCIDVRSEPFRRAIEAQGLYETYGYAGFFGVPVTVQSTTGECYASCPVLLAPQYTIGENQLLGKGRRRQQLFGLFKRLYHSAKYTFSTPFGLAESLGLLQGLWMFVKALFPTQAAWFGRRACQAEVTSVVDITSIPLAKRVEYAGGMLRAIGMSKRFAPLVVLCGHGSTSTNNAYETALDCGACGGHHGGPNAQVMAEILNESVVRDELRLQGIDIPTQTVFMAAEHDTTTDEVHCYDHLLPKSYRAGLQQFKTDLTAAQLLNNQQRAESLGLSAVNVVKQTQRLAYDWSEMRPEWGLAGNAAFIVAPRWLTKQVDLNGRCFLHSYESECDPDGSVLTAILTAPMVVAQWINSQYLFSTLDRTAFGGGNKITANVAGKIGIMQGNASDLMTGLALQSVYATDDEPYHEPMRLTVIVRAPQTRVNAVVAAQPILQKLVGNGWVNLITLDPEPGHESKAT
jgi:hypothetical protein